MKKMLKRCKILLNVGLVIFGVFLGFLILEGGLQLRRVVVYDLQPLLYVHSPRLGQRLNPAYPGHDASGWRNASTLNHANIVVFGDSQTYGVNLPIAAAWPQIMSNLLRRSVLQMAAPGYAPGHYIALYDEAMSHFPEVIIATYYFGNDLFGTYTIAYKRGDLKRSVEEPVLDSLVSTNPRIVEAIERAETIDPGFLRALYLDCQMPKWVTDPRLQLVHRVLDVQNLEPLTHDGPAEGLKSTLWRHSALAAVIRRGISWLAPRIGYRNTMVDYGSPICVDYHDSDITTVFSPGYRLIALDDTDPRIAEGERISLLVLQYLHEHCRSDGRRFYVVTIPTKETAFRARVEKSLETEPHLVELWQREARAQSNAFQFFEQHGIDVIDSLPALEALIARGINPYWDDANGHPGEAGHKAIAEAVAQRLDRDGIGH